MSGVHTAMTNTRNTPIEALERAFPLRVRALPAAARERRRAAVTPAARASSATSRCSRTCTVSLITERRVSRPWGLAGGEPGAVGENWLLPGGDESTAERLPDKCTIQLQGGRRAAHVHARRRRLGTTDDVIRMRVPCIAYATRPVDGPIGPSFSRGANQ